MSGKVVGQTGKGVFTITKVKNGWGKLKSGAGWIYLENASYCTIGKAASESGKKVSPQEDKSDLPYGDIWTPQPLNRLRLDVAVKRQQLRLHLLDTFPPETDEHGKHKLLFSKNIIQYQRQSHFYQPGRIELQIQPQW